MVTATRQVEAELDRGEIDLDGVAARADD
jgi:hypothetical protein